ncbi:glycoside hydrolase family 30 beta sandwich domain-containing protein [Armatimonas rosea]|uniref:O-glycosyl hydrolase n=1 Tax=Armatimonas rosea TaxID=685828 RepID=A0A7W9SV90_ARMRO|nr:glycoside hydrolase family 30 beta sandwich domain-containing protein [Armatimonas rosea]MBB6052574.1 O-glycosyl hydrolase [Armatimonas rosea]
MASSSKTGVLGDRSGVVFCAALGVTVAAVLGLRFRAESPRAATPSGATLQLDLAKTHQKIEGFGASTAYYQEMLAAHPERKAIYAALFGELRLNLLRLRNTYEPGKPGFAAAERDIVAGATEVRGSAPELFLASWSPPAALKSTGSTKNGGTLARRNGSYDYAGFATWWRDSVVAYQRVGLAPTYLSIQNEPNWKDHWETCLFQPQESADYASYSKALTAVAGVVQPLNNAPKFLGPETLGAENPQAFLPPSQVGTVSAVAHHLYSGGKESAPDSFIPALRAIRQSYPNTPKFQTEFGRGSGFQTAWIVHNCLTEEDASAYLYWAGVWPGPDALITMENAWQRGSWKTPQGFTRTDRFTALEHYSRFIVPGSVRVEVQSALPSLKLSAFLSPDRQALVVVGLNTASGKPVALGTEVPGFALHEVYRTVFSGAERCQAVPLPQNSTVSVPAQGLVTLVFTKRIKR